MPYRKTPVAARELEVKYYQLIGLIRYGHIDPPQRDSSGDYIWTDDDLARARAALQARRRRPSQEAARAC
jgi:hypothetical protein